MNKDEAQIVAGVDQEEAHLRSWLLGMSHEEMVEFLRHTRILANPPADAGRVVLNANLVAVHAACTMLCVGRLWQQLKEERNEA